MVFLLSATCKTIAIHSASAKTFVLSITSFKTYRGIQTSQYPQNKLSAYARKSIEKTEALTPKPKSPLPPYFRFMLQIRPSIRAEYPHLKYRELCKMITERWKLLGAEEKQILSNEYRNDLLKYSEEIAIYNRTLTDDEKRIIRQKAVDISEHKLILSYRKRARELNKPKKPACSFLKFIHEQNDRQPDEHYKQYLKRKTTRWQQLSETEKKKYETAPEEKENYKKAMVAWEASIAQLYLNSSDGKDKVKSKRKQELCDEEFAEEDDFDEEDL